MTAFGHQHGVADHELGALVTVIGTGPAVGQVATPEQLRFGHGTRQGRHDRLQMQLADAVGPPAGLGQKSRQRRQVVRQGAAVRGHAVMAWIEAGNHGAAAGRTNLVGCRVAGKTAAARGQSVQVRRAGLEVAAAAQAVGTLLISAQDQEIGFHHQKVFSCRGLPQAEARLMRLTEVHQANFVVSQTRLSRRLPRCRFPRPAPQRVFVVDHQSDRNFFRNKPLGTATPASRKLTYCPRLTTFAPIFANFPATTNAAAGTNATP